MPISLLVASSDEHFRETIRESLVNIPNARVISEYPEVSSNLYIRVLQDLEPKSPRPHWSSIWSATRRVRSKP